MTAYNLLSGSFHGRVVLDIDAERRALQAVGAPRPEPTCRYELPDLTEVEVPISACKGRTQVRYLRRDGTTALALLVSSPEEVAEAMADWEGR